MFEDYYFNVAKSYYPRFYTKDMVKVFVTSGKITEIQYKDIVGEKYVALKE